MTAIRTTKQPDYYESLSESERKEFNHWAILMWLAMDTDLIPLCSSLWREGYYDKIPSPQFYKLLVELVPKTDKKLFWIKKVEKKNKKLLNCVADWYKISTREASDYVRIFLSSDEGINELGWILTGMGMTEKDAENMILGENDNE